MKRIIFILSVIIYSSHAFSQVQLTSSINPVPGDIEAWAICDTTNISPGASGPNQTWSFTSLTTQDTATVFYVSPASTPYSAHFPGANISSTTELDSTFNYGTTSANSFLLNGAEGPDNLIHYEDPQTFMQYPFSYGSSYVDNFSANYTVGSFAITETGSSTVTGDAWGTINLPDGPHSNALRVKHILVTKDSSNSGVPLVIVTTATTYSWFVPGRKFRVFGIVYISVTFNGAPFGGDKFVNYNNGSQTIGINNISAEVPSGYSLSQNYPNPFNPTTALEFGISKSGFVSLRIYDILGKEAAVLVNEKLNPGIYKYTFDAAALPSGIYFYTLIAGEYKETKRMNLIK